jgi:hypothetical protein
MLLSTQYDDNSYLRRLLSFDDDVDGVLDVGEDHPRFFAQVTGTTISSTSSATTRSSQRRQAADGRG